MARVVKRSYWAKINSKGDLCLPAAICKAYGLEPGTRIELTIKNGLLILRKMKEL